MAPAVADLPAATTGMIARIWVNSSNIRKIPEVIRVEFLLRFSPSARHVRLDEEKSENQSQL
jgi:hypothetical protein